MVTWICASLPYEPFIDPLPVWNQWWIWALPLCLAVAIVYKSTKCARMADVPRESIEVFVWIVLGMAAAAGILYGVVALA
jgi:hypothetical protein